MEFKPIRHPEPTKSSPPNDAPPSHVASRPNPPPRPSNADSRTLYGFDDIPVESEDMSDVRFVDIFKAWAKRSIQHSPLEERAGKQKKRIDEFKNDLKWAMQADLDEPVKPTPKKPTPPKTTSNLQGTTPTHSDADPSKTIDININFGSLPKLPSPKNSITSVLSQVKAFRPNKLAVKIIGVVAVVGLGTAAWFFIPGSPGQLRDDQSSLVADSQNSPKYTTVLPDGKSADSLGGWHRVSPNDRDPVYAYADKIGGVTINVSQQPLPTDFKTDTASKVSELAKSYGAINKVEAGSDTIYIGSSGEGPQSAILAKNNTLILMKSTSKIPDAAWASYAKSLK